MPKVKFLLKIQVIRSMNGVNVHKALVNLSLIGLLGLMLIAGSAAVGGASCVTAESDNNVKSIKGDSSALQAEEGKAVVFVDETLPGAKTLTAAAADAGFAVVRLDPQQDGFRQISTVLSGKTEIEAIHIFSHGAPGEIRLGSEGINSGTLDSASPMFLEIRRALSAKGDLLLYGCRIGRNMDFVKRIAELTGADVAASEDLTGAENQGGDWILEQSTGVIEAQSLSVTGYAHVMAAYEVRGAPDYDTDANGVYGQVGTYNARPLYENLNDYVMFYSSPGWAISREAGGYVYYASSTDTATPPEETWSDGFGPVDVANAGPYLFYEKDVFLESMPDEGAIKNSLTITYTSPGADSFSGSSGTFSADKYSVSNLPAGLTAEVVKNSDTELSVSLTSRAENHTNSDDTSQLQIAFNDSAFSNGDASAVGNAAKSDLRIDFRDENEFLANTFTGDNQQYAAAAALENGGFVIAWASSGQDSGGLGIYAQRYNLQGDPEDSEFLVNTEVSGNQGNPAVAGLANGGFVITWTSDGQDGSGTGIYAQQYDSDGVPVGAEFRVNSQTVNDQENPSVAGLSTGGFVVAWNSYDVDGSGDNVYGQQYYGDGSAKGEEFLINTETANWQKSPAVAALSGGGFVVTWTSGSQDGSSNGVYAQQYDTDGLPQGDEFRVNTETAEGQQSPSVGALSDGGFVVTWESRLQDGEDFGIYAQQYDGDGSAVGSEIQVNSYTAGFQIDPSVSGLSSGGFLIAWTSTPYGGPDGQDGDAGGIFAQRYNADNSADGGEFQVNIYSPDFQSRPAAAGLSAGGHVVAWQSSGQDGDRYGVYGALALPDSSSPSNPLSSDNGGSCFIGVLAK